jgi:hypothetical protein
MLDWYPAVRGSNLPCRPIVKITSMLGSPRFQYLTYSYVVLVGGPGGQIQWDGNKLSQLFGQYGRGNVAQFPQGIGVILGDYNQLLIQLPKIVFKAALPEILFELYRNSRTMILGHFSAHLAQAFGVNFEVDVEFPGLDASKVLSRLLSDKAPKAMLLNRAQLQIDDSHLIIEKSIRDNAKIHANVNNHIENPGLASFDSDVLKDQLEAYREKTEQIIRELFECLQEQHS